MNETKHVLFRGKVVGKDKFVNATVEIDYEERGSSPVYCVAIVDEGADLQGIVQTNEDGFSYIEIVATKFTDDDVWISKVRLTDRSTARRINLQKGVILQGIAGLYAEPVMSPSEIQSDYYTCYLTLPYMELIQSQEHGEIVEISDVRSFKPSRTTNIWWNTDYGQAELIENYSSFGRSEKMGREFVEVSECQIKLKIQTERLPKWKNLVRHLHEDLDDVRWLLSFICKRNLDWFNGFISRNWDNLGVPFYKVRRDAHLGINPEQTDYQRSSLLLVENSYLLNGGFAKMEYTFRTSPYKTLMIKAIHYLIPSHENFYFEPKLGLMYIAFEMLIDVLGKDFGEIVSESEFANENDAILKILQDSKTLKENDKKEIQHKMRELRRRSLKRKAFMVFEKYGIDLSLAFPPDSNINSGFQRLVNGRNDFTHGGNIHNYDKSFLDFHRLRYLVSVLIIRVLEFPQESINPRDEDFMLARQKPEAIR